MSGVGRRRDADVVIKGVGRRIRQIRTEAGLTQQEVADQLGVTVQYAQRLEYGLNLSIRSMVKVADVLRVDVATFFERPAY